MNESRVVAAARARHPAAPRRRSARASRRPQAASMRRSTMLQFLQKPAMMKATPAAGRGAATPAVVIPYASTSRAARSKSPSRNGFASQRQPLSSRKRSASVPATSPVTKMTRCGELGRRRRDRAVELPCRRAAASSGRRPPDRRGARARRRAPLLRRPRGPPRTPHQSAHRPRPLASAGFVFDDQDAAARQPLRGRPAPAEARCRAACPPSPAARRTNDAPAPGVDCTRCGPPCSCTIAYATVSPRPVPLPTSFVVKNGSKIFRCTSSGTPGPSSFTSSSTASRSASCQRAHDQRAASVRRQHRLLGVDDQVEQHLLNLVRIGEDRRQARGERVDDRDVGDALLVRAQRERLAHDLVEVDHRARASAACART